MAYDIGPKVGIEGEAEFKKAIAKINMTLKTMGTEMKAVTSAYDKNDQSAEKLTAQNGVLNKQIDAQKNKLNELKAMLDKSKDAYGENDARTQKYQQQVNLATASLNKMERELQNNKEALNNAGKAADTSGPKFEKLGRVLKGTAVAAAAVATAAAAAAVKLGKEVLSAFGDYEQLVGGVDTLFKDSSGKLQDYAANAYKTAGLSANDYMETVTSFSASLLQSLGGDTEEAVKYADMAITDMSDNANKMGTDMASIQNAYQGFAKQNYTMLDNLKLGGHNRLAEYKPPENGGTLNVLRRRQYRVKYELKVA
jgi:chaperonin cofactor prefoldin